MMCLNVNIYHVLYIYHCCLLKKQLQNDQQQKQKNHVQFAAVACHLFDGQFWLWSGSSDYSQINYIMDYLKKLLCQFRTLHNIPWKEEGDVCCLSPCLESQGCHLIPLYYLLSYASANPCCSFCLVFFLSFLFRGYWPTLLFSRKFFSIFWFKR